MKTTILSKVLIVLLCSVNYITTHAQGLSLSFNLSETDTLANMIAESKKYDIESLTLAGYINSTNVLYIIDLNNNGRLKDLDISKVSHFDYYSKREYQYSYEWGGNVGIAIGDMEKEELHSSLRGLLNQNAPNHSGRLDMDRIIIEDNYRNTHIIRSFHFYFHDLVSDVKYNFIEKRNISYSANNPKMALSNCVFNKIAIPDSLLYIGGNDLTYSVTKCIEYRMGSKIKVIADNAFKDSYIGSLIVNSKIDSIKAHAFEGARGNVLANISFLEKIRYIGESAFKNSNLLENPDKTISLQASIICKCAFQNAVVPYTILMNNIEEIGDSAFSNSSVTNIEIGLKLLSLSNESFAFCSNLQSFSSGTNINSIGNGAFYGCKKLKIFNPSTKLTSIGKEAFANTALVNFSVPNTTTTIGYKAFANSGLKELDLGVFDSYRRDIIDGCDSLEIFSVNDNNDNLKAESGVLFSKSGSRIISYPCAKKDAIYELGNNVTEVSDSAFYDVNKLGALVISENVSKIGKNAFGNSSVLELKVLPSTTPKVTDNISGLDQSLVKLFVHEKDYSTYYIANYWGDFKNIFVLEKTVSPDNLINVEVAGTLPNYIGFGNQFKYNSLRLSGKLNGDDIRYLREMAGRDVNGKETAGVLTNLDFSLASIVKGGDCYYKKNEYSSGKLTTADNEIGDSMFEGCNFSNLIISENAIKIGDKALYRCPLTTFRLPSATKELNSNSFIGMATLKEFVVDSDNPNYLSLNGVLFTKDGKSLLLYPYAKPEERYSTPETTTSIGEHAFGGSHLKTIITNEGLKEIGTMAFNNLGSLEGISLPSTLETIGHRAFYGCNNLLDITCKAYYPPTLKYDSYSYYGQPYNNFSDKTYKNAVLFVPKKNGGYTSRSGWKLFNNVIESDDWMSGIQAISGSDNAEIIKSYDLNGRVVTSSYHGVSILKMSNGTTKKVFVK